MKRASSASKTKSAAPGAKRKPRRRRVVVKKTPAPAKRKPIAKAKLVTKREPVPKSKPIAKPKSVAKAKPIVKRKARPKLRPVAKPQSATRRPLPQKSPVRRSRLKIPAYLLEGDVPVVTAVTGPGEKYALGPASPAAPFAAETAHLPEAYGTGRLYVTPRDPHWLYAHWDLTPQQQFRHNARSVDRHLILRIHEGVVRERPVTEIHVHPESRHWFAHVGRSETVYVTELGYYETDRRWKSLAMAAPTKTPADRVSSAAAVEFATIPLELPFETMLELVRDGVPEKLPLAQAIEQLRVSRQSRLTPRLAMSAWTPEQEQALAEFIARERETCGWPSSLEISELLGGQTESDFTNPKLGELDLSSFSGAADVSSPVGGGPASGNNFWSQVNAWLPLQGATPQDPEPGLPTSEAL